MPWAVAGHGNGRREARASLTVQQQSAEGIVCAWQLESQAGSSPARPEATGRYPKVGVMPHWPQEEEGMEKSTRARTRKRETAKTDLQPPPGVLRRAGCSPRGEI